MAVWCPSALPPNGTDDARVEIAFPTAASACDWPPSSLQSSNAAVLARLAGDLDVLCLLQEWLAVSSWQCGV